MRAADIEWIKTRLTAAAADPYDTQPDTTPTREYVVIHPGESHSPVERYAAVQSRTWQVWRLRCISRSLPALRALVARATAEFTGARFGSPHGPVIREVEIGPELADGDPKVDRRYSQTITYRHINNTRSPS